MRERLVAAFVGLTVLVIVLYGVPRAYSLADLVRDGEQVRVDRTALALAPYVEERLAADEPVTAGFLDSLATSGEVVSLTDVDGTTTTSGGEPGDGEVSSARELGSGATLTVTRTGEAVGEQVSQAILPLVLVGLALVLLSALAGLVLARRLSRPFRQLAEAARALGTGRFHPDVPIQQVPEAQAIGAALVSAGADLEALVQHERALAVRASHELRTPVTALRLELEDLALWPETAPVVVAELQRSIGELDRLSSAIDDLLEMSAASRRDRAVDLDLDDLLAGFASRPRTDGVVVVHESTGPASVRLAPDVVEAALDELVELAAASGTERVGLRVERRSAHVDVLVSGGSERHAGSAAAADHWRAAAEHAASAGGITSRKGDSLVLRLPVHQTAGTHPGALPGS